METAPAASGRSTCAGESSGILHMALRFPLRTLTPALQLAVAHRTLGPHPERVHRLHGELGCQREWRSGPAALNSLHGELKLLLAFRAGRCRWQPGAVLLRKRDDLPLLHRDRLPAELGRSVRAGGRLNVRSDRHLAEPCTFCFPPVPLTASASPPRPPGTRLSPAPSLRRSRTRRARIRSSSATRAGTSTCELVSE